MIGLTLILMVATLSSVSSNPPNPQDSNSGLVYGENFSFWITAPKGWILDNESGKDQGLTVVFYPQGSSWKDSIAVMYANTSVKERPHQTLDDYIQGDLEKFKTESKNLAVHDSGSLETKDHKRAVIRVLSGDAYGNFESIAYIEEPQIFVMLVLTSKDKPNWEKSRGAFNELVKSYELSPIKVINQVK